MSRNISRVGVFGAGSAARDFIDLSSGKVEIVGVFDGDRNKYGKKLEGFDIFPSENINKFTLDYVVIASRAIDEIKEYLISKGIGNEKIVSYYPSYSQSLYKSVNRDIEILNKIGLNITPIGMSTMYLDVEGAKINQNFEPQDFVRNKSFELAAREVHKRGVSGSVAELGVYKGDQARLINGLFPERDLYLFDTFEGFSEKDLDAERSNKFSGAVIGDFSDTSVNTVLEKLPYPNRAKVFKGFFPESAEGIEESFAFVSLDVDLYAPILAGLSWFFPRLSAGGYIFVHDYNNVRYKGVRQAVDEFMNNNSAVILPIPDFTGSVIVAK